jgi:hypothetical protein
VEAAREFGESYRITSVQDFPSPYNEVTTGRRVAHKGGLNPDFGIVLTVGEHLFVRRGEKLMRMIDVTGEACDGTCRFACADKAASDQGKASFMDGDLRTTQSARLPISVIL